MGGTYPGGPNIPAPVKPVVQQPSPSPVPDYAGELEIDIYHGDAEIDYAAMKAEGRVKRIYHKINEYHVDTTFAAHIKKAQLQGFKCGGYCFFRANIGGDIQANQFVKAIKDASIVMDLPPCLDWESGSDMGLSSAKQQIEADKFISIVEQAFGKTSEIYGGESFLRGLNLPIKYARNPLWLAHYQTTFNRLNIPFPWNKLQGWQYTDAETVAGLPKGRHVDASWVYNG